jgi:hypothetical protein
MITPMRMSTPTPKSAVRPTPHKPAQAAPVRRESVPAGGDVPRGNGGGITPSPCDPWDPNCQVVFIQPPPVT